MPRGEKGCHVPSGRKKNYPVDDIEKAIRYSVFLVSISFDNQPTLLKRNPRNSVFSSLTLSYFRNTQWFNQPVENLCAPLTRLLCHLLIETKFTVRDQILDLDSNDKCIIMLERNISLSDGDAILNSFHESCHDSNLYATSEFVPGEGVLQRPGRVRFQLYL